MMMNIEIIYKGIIRGGSRGTTNNCVGEKKVIIF